MIAAARMSFPLNLCLTLVLAGAVTQVLAADKPKAATVPAAVASKPVSAPLVQVSGAWIRATVKGQSGTGGFMQLLSAQPLTLTGFASQAASSTELHEMSMDGSVMRMRAVEALALPPGQAVSLRPGGHHLMLMGLKQPLKDGDTVALTLLLKAEDGKLLKQDVLVPVKAAAPADMGHRMDMNMGMGASGPHQGMSHEGGMIKSMAY